jgi:hypothetical protein
MEEPKRSEVQSKTVLIDEVEGVDSILSKLNSGREKVEKKRVADKKRRVITNIIIALISAIVAGTAVFFLLR